MGAFRVTPGPARYAPGQPPREEPPMSAFTDSELEYLRSQGLARLATVGPDGQPHVVPVTFNFNADEDAVDVGGVDFGNTKKWRDARRNPRVPTFAEEFLRIRPTRIVSWGLAGQDGITPDEFRLDARDVGQG